MNITLTPDIERFANDLAKKQGTDVESIVLKTLRECFFRTQRSKTVEQPESLADLLTGYVGAIDSGELAQGGLQLSENSGKRFTELLGRKQQQGKI
jgi:hypothetical protein